MTNEILKIALLQTNLIWEHPAQNRVQLAEKVNAITETVDIIILPEMFTSGFTMKPEIIAETMNGETMTWIKALAKAKNVCQNKFRSETAIEIQRNEFYVKNYCVISKKSDIKKHYLQSYRLSKIAPEGKNFGGMCPKLKRRALIPQGLFVFVIGAKEIPRRVGSRGIIKLNYYKSLD